MDTAPQDSFVRVLVILWTACPSKREYCPYFSVPLRELGYRGKTKKTHRCCSVCSFFLMERKKYLFSNLDYSLFIVWINMLFVIKSLFVFLFTQYPKQMQTLHNALNVVQIGEEKGKNRLFSLVSVKFGTIGLTFIVGNCQLGKICVKCVLLQQSFKIFFLRPCSHLIKLWSWTHKASKLSLCQKKALILL